MSESGLDISEFRGLEGMEQLRDEWRGLSASMPDRSSYHVYEVHRGCLKHLCRYPELSRFLLIREHDETRAIVPLYADHDKVFGREVSAWSLPRHPHFQITDVIAPEDERRREILRVVVDYLRRHSEHRSILVVGRLPLASELWREMPALGPTERYLELSTPSNYLDTTLPFEQLQTRFSKRFRRSLRAHQNRLGEMKAVHFVHATERRDVLSEFETFLDIEASGWKGPGGTASAIKLHPELTSYYREIAETLCGPEDRCEINSLYVSGRCVASIYALRTGSKYSILKIGYDEEFSSLMPGLILIEKTLERCCGDPTIKCMDMVSNSAWLSKWGTQKVPMLEARLAISPAGRVAVGALSFRHGPVHRMAAKLRSIRSSSDSVPSVG